MSYDVAWVLLSMQLEYYPKIPQPSAMAVAAVVQMALPIKLDEQ